MAEPDREPNNRIEEARKDWETHVLAPALKRLPESNQLFNTGSGAPLEPLYLPQPFEPSTTQIELLAVPPASPAR